MSVDARHLRGRRLLRGEDRRDRGRAGRARLDQRVEDLERRCRRRPSSSSEKRLPATWLHQPALPSNGRCGPFMPSARAARRTRPRLPAWPAATAFHIERWPVRTCFSTLFGTTAIDRQCRELLGRQTEQLARTRARRPCRQKFAQSKRARADGVGQPQVDLVGQHHRGMRSRPLRARARRRRARASARRSDGRRCCPASGRRRSSRRSARWSPLTNAAMSGVVFSRVPMTVAPSASRHARGHPARDAARLAEEAADRARRACRSRALSRRGRLRRRDLS